MCAVLRVIFDVFVICFKYYSILLKSSSLAPLNMFKQTLKKAVRGDWQEFSPFKSRKKRLTYDCVHLNKENNLVTFIKICILLPYINKTNVHLRSLGLACLHAEERTSCHVHRLALGRVNPPYSQQYLLGNIFTDFCKHVHGEQNLIFCC